MVAVPSINLLSVPTFSFSTITDKIARGMEKQLVSSVKEFTETNDALYNFAYKKEVVLTEEEMNSIEKMDDFLLWYSDILADYVEDDINRAMSIYNYLDELYTLTLKMTTSISYIRSKNRQLNNAA